MSTPKRLRACDACQTGIGACFPLAATGSSGSNADRALRRPHRRGIDDDGADRRCALQARRRVDDVARDHALPALRSRPERDDRRTCRHCRAHGDVETLLPQLRHRLEDPERGPNGPLGVVLVRDRSSEHGHDGVADELLHRAAEPLDVGFDPFVVRTERGADVLGVGAVGAVGEAHEVDEQDRHDLPLLAARDRLGQAGAASETEARVLDVLLTARRADDHRRIFAATGSGVYAAGGRSGGSKSSSGGSSSSARRRWSTLRERTPIRRPCSRTGTRSASCSSRKRNASSSGTSGAIV